jgi:signal transduction histidine kinase
MSEAFIPPAAATPAQEVTIEGWGTGTVAEIEHHLAHLKEELEASRSAVLAYQKRELETEPLVEAIQYIVERRIERWIDSEYGREQLGRVIEEQLSSSIDSHVEAALEGATVEVDAYIRL